MKKTPLFLPIGKDYYDPQFLINHEHIRNALIRAFNDGMMIAKVKYEERLQVIQDNFFIGESQIKKVLSQNEYKKKVPK